MGHKPYTSVEFHEQIPENFVKELKVAPNKFTNSIKRSSSFQGILWSSPIYIFKDEVGVFKGAFPGENL